MATRPISERLFETLCSSRGVSCDQIPTESARTPQFVLAVRVICELKQIDPNPDDLAELQAVNSGEATGRYVPNRLRSKLKNVSGQLKAASVSGCPTLLVVYDNTPFKMYSTHFDVLQALFGVHSVTVAVHDAERARRRTDRVGAVFRWKQGSYTTPEHGGECGRHSLSTAGPSPSEH